MTYLINILRNKLTILILVCSFNSFASNCDIRGGVTGYTLALTWLPGFCKTNKFHECNEAEKYRYFNLHGLWPEKEGCGDDFGYCGKVKEPTNKCNYPEINISSDTYHQLKYVMPNAKHNGCLAKHEWWKHGTCSVFDVEQYYRISIKYVEEFNQNKFFQQFIKNNIGKLIDKEELYRYFDASYGTNAHKSLQLVCDEGNLTEIRVALPSEIRDGRIELRRIIGKAFIAKQTNCGVSFYIAN